MDDDLLFFLDRVFAVFSEVKLPTESEGESGDESQILICAASFVPPLIFNNNFNEKFRE